MNDIDSTIRTTLGEEPPPEDPSVLEEVLAVMKGRRRWLNRFGGGLTALFTVAAIYSIYRYFDASAERAMTFWGFCALGAIILVQNLKIWWWMEMEKNAVLREIKRLELQLARMRDSLDQP